MTCGGAEQGEQAAALAGVPALSADLAQSQHFPGLGFILWGVCVTQTQGTESRGVTEGTEEPLLSFCHMPEAAPNSHGSAMGL